MIVVKDVKKRFGDEEILKGISTTFEKGKTNLIIGQSGSGKSVLLKCLLGLFTPEEGRIHYEDKAIQDMNDDQQRELREEIGMLFQGGALFDSMTI
jgi:phospholipid/cholesterol/gamma-HCH transport system ATP-binding protein